MERGSVIDAQEERHSFCEDAEGNCTMNYCDENGCVARKRNLVPLPDDPEWEMYQEMCAQAEEADNELSEPRPPRHCPIPKDDFEMEAERVAQ